MVGLYTPKHVMLTTSVRVGRARWRHLPLLLSPRQVQATRLRLRALFTGTPSVFASAIAKRMIVLICRLRTSHAKKS
jgi:hypothetical protein